MNEIKYRMISSKGLSGIKTEREMVEIIKEQVIEEVCGDALYFIESGLSGIPEPSFDLGKVNYRIDNLDVRLERITENIVRLVMDAMLPKLELLIESRIREKIRKSI